MVISTDPLIRYGLQLITGVITATDGTVQRSPCAPLVNIEQVCKTAVPFRHMRKKKHKGPGGGVRTPPAQRGLSSLGLKWVY